MGCKYAMTYCLFILVLLLSFTLGTLDAQGLKMAKNVLDKIHFRNIGPTKQGGRFMTFAVPNPQKQPYTFYAAGSNGGLWKSMDNGLTYEAQFQNEIVNAIGDVAVSYSDPDIVWVGTGNLSYWGEGVFKSTDGGQTWTHMGLQNSLFVTRMRIHPENPDIVYVAATGDEGAPDFQGGLFKTVDGGKTWIKSLKTGNDTHNVGAGEIVMHPHNPDILYVTTWDRADGEGSGIYKTVDAGKSWTKLTSGLPSGKLQRIGLDIHRNNPEILVAAILVPRPEARRGVRNTIWRSENGGDSWQRIDPEEFNLRGGNRFARVIIDPFDAGRIYVLNTGVQGTPDGGKTWKKMIRFGGDNQDLWINPENSKHMMLAYDYGIAISFSGGETWYHPDNLPLGQLESVGFDMEYPYNVYGGMQDFGTWKGPSTKRGRFPIRFEDWEHVRGADGSYAQVDPSDSRWLYVESQNGSISRNDQKTNVRTRIRYRREGIRFNFIAPILISPHNSNVIYHGANVLLRSDFRGEDWQEISPDLTNEGEGVEGRRIKGSITTIAESPLAQGVIWVGTDDGNIQLTKDGGETWTKLNEKIPNKPNKTVTRVDASHHAPGTAYISFSGGRRNRRDLKPYVFKTTDFGQTWTSIANNLPQEPVNVIREDPKNPNLLFVGTAKGIYVSLDSGGSWNSLRNNMPNVPIHDLEIHPRENDLIVGTYGRSFWIADISPLQQINSEVLNKNEYLFAIEPQVLWILAGQKQVAAALQNFDGENAPHGVVVNYYLKEKARGPVKVQIYRGSWLVNEYSGSGEPGLNSVEWYLTERTPRKEDEKKEWDEWYAEDEEEYFDYYDGHDHFGEPDEEVSVYGRSLEIWIHTLKEWRERDYQHVRAQPGEYTVKLLVNGKELTGKVNVLQDHAYVKQW